MNQNKARKVRDERKEELKIQHALRTGGFLFPETEKEVTEYEKNFGTTEYVLPDDLWVPSFLTNKAGRPMKRKSSIAQSENLALAARDGTKKISDEVRQKMNADRKKAESRFSKKKK